MASSLARTRSKQLSYTRVTDKIIHNEDIYASLAVLIIVRVLSRLQHALIRVPASKNTPAFAAVFLLVAPPRLELGTQGSSGLCSTD